jgi:hexosaminidase
VVASIFTACSKPVDRPLPRETPSSVPSTIPSQTLALTHAITLITSPVPPTLTPRATPSIQLEAIIPRPVSVSPADGMFYLTPGMEIFVQPGHPEVAQVAQFLADLLNPATGYDIPVQVAKGAPTRRSIVLTLDNADTSLGDEGYRLEITSDLVSVNAIKPAGLFYAVQTIRQLLPASIESATRQPGPWVLPAGTIVDYPRFAYRGVMLDVVRHFFTLQDVERMIDLLTLYKINYLHLHLTDDQGWRIEIKSWPDLTAIGGRSEIDGGPGGFYTQDEYAELVAYAQSRFITIVPEIDMPGHVTAALASYPDLNCDGIAPPIYTTIHVNYSTLCIPGTSSYQFMQDVLHELASLTPGPFLHVGGDEAGATSPENYVAFMQRAQSVVEANGKQMVGWEEIAQIKLSPGSVVQHWNYGEGYILPAIQQGSRLIMSPIEKTYMNVKYDSSTLLGPDIGFYLNVETAYSWDPLSLAAGLAPKDVLGIEAPLWTETLQSLPDLEYMVFPRLPGYAEIGWTPQEQRDWQDYRLRLAGQGPRLAELKVNYYPSAEIPWK